MAQPPRNPGAPAVRRVPDPKIIDMPVDTGDDDEDELEDDEPEDDEDDEDDGGEADGAADDEGEADGDGDDEAERMFVSLLRDTTIWIVYASLDVNITDGTAAPALEFSGRGLWRMDADGFVELLDGMRDGVAQLCEESENFCGVIDRLPTESEPDRRLRAMGELAERIKAVLDRKL